MARLEVSPEAACDLEEIGLYITRHSGSTRRAEAFLDEIYRTLELLATQPEMGELRKDFLSRRYRSFTVGNYVIYYGPVHDGIRVARVLHGARDHTTLL